MTFPAFLDTCTIYSATLNDTLLRIAEEEAFRPHWSADVIAELRRALVREAGLTEPQAQHRVDQMRRAFPDAEVHGYRRLVDAMTCHPKDRHVLAAAVHAKCEVLVTFNLKDFPGISLRGLHITVTSPDAFLLDQLDLYPARVGRALLRQVEESSRPHLTLAHSSVGWHVPACPRSPTRPAGTSSPHRTTRDHHLTAVPDGNSSERRWTHQLSKDHR